jgi:hypothetical protein
MNLFLSFICIRPANRRKAHFTESFAFSVSDDESNYTMFATPSGDPTMRSNKIRHADDCIESRTVQLSQKSALELEERYYVAASFLP